MAFLTPHRLVLSVLMRALITTDKVDFSRYIRAQASCHHIDRRCPLLSTALSRPVGSTLL